MRGYSVKVNTPRRIALVIALSFVGTLVAASPAQAAEQPLFGTTVDVFAPTSGDSLLGGVAHISSTGALVVQLDSPLGSDVDVSILRGGLVDTSCTIDAGLSGCTLLAGGLFANGANAVTVRFTMGATTVDYAGTLFIVTSDAPTFRVQWRDAAGEWVDGSGVGLPLFVGQTALRCTITNNSNAPITLTTVSATVSGGADPVTAPLTGTIGAGATGTFDVWSGAVDSLSVSCTGSVTLRSGIGSGGGNGGGLTPVGGTIELDQTPAPGVTVTLTGDNITPPVISTFAVLLDGVEVSGSPVSITSPDFDFATTITIPSSLAPGSHAITLVGAYEGREITFAFFPFEVAQPELAATGATLDVPAGIGLSTLIVGLALIAGARMRRPALARAAVR